MSSSDWQFYTTAKSTWESMLSECDKAKKSIEIEQYIFASDTIGNQFIELFKKKRVEGVSIRLLIDMAGSYEFYISQVPNELKELGIEIKFFNIISPWRVHHLHSWFFRDHRKILIIDGVVGFTGGLGIRDNMTDWRDTTAKLEGTVVQEMADSFSDMWALADKDIFFRIKIIRKYLRRKEFISNDPYFKQRYLYKSIVEAIKKAQASIYISTPYYISNHTISRILRLAVRRGVQVKLIIPKTYDVPVISYAVEASSGNLLKHGVKVYKYQPVFTHAKVMIIDEKWATFGSFNMDNLSFYRNHEANVITTDIKYVKDLTSQFFDDLKECKEFTFKEWKNKPLTTKIIEFFVARIRTFL